MSLEMQEELETEEFKDFTASNINIAPITFARTPFKELKDRPFPKTAACLIIGDEILNGKTIDTNSGFFAKFCFDLGIDLKRIEVIPDERDQIIEAVRRLSRDFDLVVTSGGIGSTHDDITYPSIAGAFDLELAYHEESVNRLKRAFSNAKIPLKDSEQETAKRMALFPTPSLVIYPCEKFWGPIVIVNGNVHILPGVPSFFRILLTDFGKYYLKHGEKYIRVFVRTNQIESLIAPTLQEAQQKVDNLGVKIGSYPKWTKDGKHWVVVSFVARENKKDLVETLAQEVATKIRGYITTEPDEYIKEKL